ncbi:hypothetical protein D3C79_951700 [compost metagenome]
MAVDDRAVVGQAVFQGDADVRGRLLWRGQGADEVHLLQGLGHRFQADADIHVLDGLDITSAVFAADGHGGGVGVHAQAGYLGWSGWTILAA